MLTKWRRPSLWPKAALVLLGTSSLACAGDLSDPGSTDELLKQQQERIEQLEQRLQQLEREVEGAVDEKAIEAATAPESEDDDPDALSGEIREKHQLMTRDELSSDEFPASWPMFGTNMRMKIGGYIKTDFVADFDGTLDPTQFLMRTIPVEGTPEYGADAYVDFFAKETRFNLDIRRIVAGSPPLRGFIEGDFFSSGNNFRLRHAYITAGNFIAGQTWTTLSFLEAMPYMIDFAAGDALFGGRATQLRYQRQLNERWKLSVGLEELQFLGIQNANNLPGKATTQWPLVAARADYRYDRGVLFMGASVGQLHWDGGSSGSSDSAVQVAVVVAGRQNLTESAYATVAYVLQRGCGREHHVLCRHRRKCGVGWRMETSRRSRAFSTLLGFGYDWTSTWSSNLSWAYGWLDTPDTRDPLALRRGGIGHVNLIWKPATQFSTGIEFMWGETRVQNGAAGDATRLQLMAKFEF